MYWLCRLGLTIAVPLGAIDAEEEIEPALCLDVRREGPASRAGEAEASLTRGEPSKEGLG